MDGEDVKISTCIARFEVAFFVEDVVIWEMDFMVCFDDFLIADDCGGVVEVVLLVTVYEADDDCDIFGVRDK